MSSILGGLAPRTFLREYWQKRPLVIRQAFPNFNGLLSPDELLMLAQRGDAISRLVVRHSRRWERDDGPLGELRLPRKNWTVLVHGVESLVPGGWELLNQFAFIPAARIDDLMVSYAADGGSVGAHDDDYDVFLLQGPGRRRWQVSTNYDPAVDEKAAIKVLRHFTPEEEWLLEPGDMLYLPPKVAHLGVAEGPCFTYSIGFLAPSHRDLVQSFLGFLGNALSPEGMVVDRSFPKNRLEVSDPLVRQIAAVLDGISWDASLVEDFTGCFLTRPKPHVRFQPRGISLEVFARKLRSRGRLKLALPSRGLQRRGKIYFNGEAHRVRSETLALFTQLINQRFLPLPIALRDVEIFHAWCCAGYLTV